MRISTKHSFLSKLAGVLVGGMLLAAPSLTAAQVYECDRTSMSRGGFVSDKIFVRFESGGQASVIDAFINGVHGKPIRVGMSKLDGSRYQIKWKVDDVKLSNSANPTTLSSTFVIDTANNSFRINGNLRGYDNVISGKGTCKRS